MRSALILVSLTAALVTFSGCGRSQSNSHVADNSLSNDSPGIVNGELVTPTDPIANPTVAVLIGDEVCSGVAIAPRIVLSAAHCFPSKNTKALIVFGKAVSKEATRNKLSIASSAIVVHENWRANVKDSRGDLAVIVLSRPAPEGTRFAKLLPVAFPIKRGDWFIAAGYGATSSTGAQRIGSSPARERTRLRKTTLQVEDWENATEIRSNGRLSGPCFGDSGGPAFLEIENELFLWGIDVRSGDRSPCHDTVTHTALSPYLTWIEQTTQLQLARAK